MFICKLIKEEIRLKLQDKVVIITGGAGGIGSGMAKAMVKEGAIVAIIDVNEESGRSLEAELTGIPF